MLLKKGMYDNVGVRELQQNLAKLGYVISVDGDFGGGTEAVVKSFQKKYNLKPDGVVGGKTFAKIDSVLKLEVSVGSTEPSHTISANQDWVKEALLDINVHEVRDEDKVHQMWRDAKLSGLAKVSASKVPWCSGAVCAWFERAGIRSARTDGAKNWLNWGVKLDAPVDGCVVVFTRKGGGHVGLVVGEDVQGNLLVLGGNQGNAVNIKSFAKSRVTGYRYPEGYEIPTSFTVGLSATDLSTNEA